MEIIKQKQLAMDGTTNQMSTSELLSKHLKSINLFDETISCVSLDLLTQRLQAPNRLKSHTQTLETLDKVKPEEFTAEDRARLATLEQQLQDLRR
jgi:hypothetical protein